MTELSTKQVVGRYHDLRQKLLSRGADYEDLQTEMYAVWASYLDMKNKIEERLNWDLDCLEGKFEKIESKRKEN